MRKNSQNQQTQKLPIWKDHQNWLTQDHLPKKATTYVVLNGEQMNDTTLSSGTKLGFMFSSLLFDTVQDVSARELGQRKRDKKESRLARKKDTYSQLTWPRT